MHDPELRHGHKSSRRRFDGHKAAIVVDTDSQLITAVDVLPGNAPDNLEALELVEASEASTGSVVEETMGDAAYGYGGTRQTFAEAGRRLVAKVPGRPNRSHFPKDDFHLDLAAGGVNLNSIATENEGQHGVVIITTDQTDHALAILNQAGLKAVSDEAVLVQLPDQPGALADLATVIKDTSINIRTFHIIERRKDYVTAAITTDDQARAKTALASRYTVI